MNIEIIMVTDKDKIRTHEIHLEGNRVVQWINHWKGQRIPFRYTMRAKGHTVYTDKKGSYIRLNLGCGEVHKHYLK